MKELNIRHLQLLYWQLPFYTEPLAFRNLDVPPDVLNKIRSDLLRKEARERWGSVCFAHETTKITKTLSLKITEVFTLKPFQPFHFLHYPPVLGTSCISCASVLLSSPLFSLISFLRSLGNSATLLQMDVLYDRSKNSIVIMTRRRYPAHTWHMGVSTGTWTETH